MFISLYLIYFENVQSCPYICFSRNGLYFKTYDYFQAEYTELHKGAKKHDVNLYPCYDLVKRERDRCVPSSGIQSTDFSVEVNFASLVEHTTKRVASLVGSALQDVEAGSTLLMTFKTGFDGSTGKLNMQITIINFLNESFKCFKL